jgi:hypothetical protein
MKIALTTIALALLVCVSAVTVVAQRGAAPPRSNANGADPWVSVRTTKELLVENPPCVELDIDHVTSFDEKTKPQP